LWHGIRMLGEPVKASQGYEFISHSIGMYKDLEEDCKDEPQSLAEAKYGIAVGWESLAMFDAKDLQGLGGKKLEECKKLYEDVAKGSTTKTPYAVLAARRLEQLNNPAEYASIQTFYREFSAKTRLGRAQ